MTLWRQRIYPFKNVAFYYAKQFDYEAEIR